MLANPKAEQMEPEELSALQLAQLARAFSWARERSRFYGKKLVNAPQEMQSLSDLEKVPFTTLPEILAANPFDFLAVPFSALARISRCRHTSPIIRMYMPSDVERNVQGLARALAAAGVTRASSVGILGDLSSSRLLDLLYASEMLGATAIPMGTDLEGAVSLLQISHADTLLATQPLLMQLIVQAQSEGQNPADLPLKSLLSVNEAIANPMRKHIRERLKAKMFDLYAPVEMGTANILYQCEQGGYHIQEDAYLAEIVEFNGNRVIHEAGRMGELVLTALSRGAMPLLRYRTGQAVMRLEEPCTCGRTFLRITTPLSMMR